MIWQGKLKYRNETHPRELFLCHTILVLLKFLLNASNLVKPRLHLLKRFHVKVMYLVLNTFHTLSFVWLSVQLCCEGRQSTPPLSPDQCKQVFSSEDEPLVTVNSETFVWFQRGNLQHLLLSSHLQIVQIFCVLNLLAISHRTHHWRLKKNREQCKKLNWAEILTHTFFLLYVSPLL